MLPCAIRAFLKRALDIYLSLLLLIVSIVPMLIIGITIKLSDRNDSVIFSQKRYTLRMKTFDIFKFRTMKNGEVTYLGKFLRKYGLDELPQLFNVLLGDMSFVGPRAHCILEADRIMLTYPDYMERFSARAGITGISQVQHLSTKDQNRLLLMIENDINYCENPSLRKDITVMLRTFQILLGGQSW